MHTSRARLTLAMPCAGVPHPAHAQHTLMLDGRPIACALQLCCLPLHLHVAIQATLFHTHVLGAPVVRQSADVEAVRVGRLAWCIAVCLGRAVPAATVYAEHACIDGGVWGGGAQQHAPVGVVLAGTGHL